MDNFKFTLKMEEIENAKTLKAKEGLIREMYDLLIPFTGGCKWSTAIDDDADINSLENVFICITKGLKVYNGSKDIPDFIVSKVDGVSRTLLAKQVTDKRSYDRIKETYKYVNNPIVKVNDGDLLKGFAEIVEDKPLPFDIDLNWYTNTTFSAMFDTLDVPTNNLIEEIFQLEEIKRSLSPDIVYTVVEEELKWRYVKVKMVDEFADKALELAKNSVIVAETFKAKVDG